MDNEVGNDTARQEERRLNTIQRLWGVVFSPGETFRDIVARPYSLAAALAAIAVSVFSVVLVIPKLQAYTAWEMERAAEMISPEEWAAYQEFGAAAVAGAAVVGAALAPVVIWLVCALVLKFFNMFAGEQVPFRQFFAVAVYAYVPVLLGGLVAAVMMMFSRVENFPYVTTSLAALFPGMEIGFAYYLLARVDPFALWTIALLGIGGAQAMRTSVRNLVVYLLVLWFLYAVVTAALGAAFTPEMTYLN
jgi:hypothetical protein